MEYVTEKAELHELQKKVKSWERKVEIAEVRAAPRNKFERSNTVRGFVGIPPRSSNGFAFCYFSGDYNFQELLWSCSVSRCSLFSHLSFRWQ